MDLSIRSCSVPVMTSLTDTCSVVCFFSSRSDIVCSACSLGHAFPCTVYHLAFLSLFFIVCSWLSYHTYAVSLLRHVLYYNAPLNAKLYVQSPSSSTSSASSPRVVVRVHFRGDLRQCEDSDMVTAETLRRSCSHVTHQRLGWYTVLHVRLQTVRRILTTSTPVKPEKKCLKMLTLGIAS